VFTTRKAKREKEAVKSLEIFLFEGSSSSMFSALRSTAVLAPQLALPPSWSSVRTYIANFWNRPTRYPYVGHVKNNERWFMHRKLKVRLALLFAV
jgi:hypothetical protein